MRWWLKSRRPAWLVAVPILGTLAVLADPGTVALAIPSLSGVETFAPTRPSALVAALIAVNAWAALSAGQKSAMLAATRRMKWYAFGELCATVLVCAVIVLSWASVLGEVPVTGQLLLRNVLGFFGFGLLSAPLTGYRFAGVLSIVYLLMAAVFGRVGGDLERDAALWAWPISDLNTAYYWIPALVLFSAGAVAWLAGPAERYPRVMRAQAMDQRRE
jgi:hypothetical protein